MRIPLTLVKPEREIGKRIVKIGFSPFLILASDSVIIIALNAVLQYYGGADYGDTLITAATIVQSYMLLITAPMLGVTGGSQPLISYNYGAKNYERITEFFKITCVVSLAISAITTIIMFVFPDFLVGLFSSKSDIEIIQMSKIALLLSAPSYLFSWFSMTVGCFLTGFEKATESMIIMLAESVVLPLVMIVVLTKLMGVYGIFLIPTIGGIVSTIIGLVLWKKCVKEELQIAD